MSKLKKLPKPYQYVTTSESAKEHIEKIKSYATNFLPIVIQENVIVRTRKLKRGIRFDLGIRARHHQIGRPEWVEACRTIWRMISEFLGRDINVFMGYYDKPDAGWLRISFQAYVMFKEFAE